MGVLANVFGGSTGQFGGGPTAVTAQGLTSEGFDLTKPFIQDVLEAGRAQFFEDTTDPETGDTIQQLAPFEQFTGPRLADFSGEQQEAFSGLQALARSGINTTPDLSSSVPYFQQAKDQAGLGSLAFTEADANRLMNPFLRGVTDTAKREAIRQYEGTIQPKLDASAVQAGSFGGSRAAILEAEGQRNLQQQLSDIEERGLATAFEQAQKGFESERGRQLQSSALFSALGEAAPAQAARELALLSSTGEAKQAQEQAALNLAEKDFIEQREFPLRQLQEYQSLVRGFPFTPSTYQVTSRSEPQPSFGQQLLGTLGTGAGIFGALGGFSNKAGGQVVPRQSGGQIRGGLAGLERHQTNVNPTRGRRVTREDIRRTAPFAGIIPIASDIVYKLFGSGQAPAGIQPKFSGQRASDLPPVVRVGEAAPGNLSETSALVEQVQPKEKSLLDSPSTSDDTYGGDLSAYNDLLEQQFRRQQTIEDLERIKKAQPIRGGREERTIEERRKGENIPDFDAFTPPKLSDEEAAKEQEKAAAIKNQEAEVAALKNQAKEEAVIKQAAKAGGGTTPVLNSNERKRLEDGSPELSKVYKELDTAFSDYLSFLEKKKGEGAERLSEAEESREARLFAELAATSARFAGQAGPGGFLAKLNQAALPSIAELKNIQGDFRKESRAAKDIEGDILKDKLNINLAKTKLDMERSKLASENDLRAAKAEAERVSDTYGLDADKTFANLVKTVDTLSIGQIDRITIIKRYTSLLRQGYNPTDAVNTALGFSRTKTPDNRSTTTQAALNDAQQAAKKKLDAANKLSKS